MREDTTVSDGSDVPVTPTIFLSGVLSKGHVRCPWHGACFNIATGDIEDFPGLDSLPTFQVTFPR